MVNTHPLPRLCIIVAQAENRAIGKDGDMPWHLSADLRRFKELTMGHPVVMGRRTWESLPKRPLPGRRNIVFSQHSGFSPEGAEVVHSINGLFAALNPSSASSADEEAFIIGGGTIYSLLMPWVSRLYVTWVHRYIPDADTFFPVIDGSAFTLVHQSQRLTDEKSGIEYSFAEYDRKECINTLTH